MIPKPFLRICPFGILLCLIPSILFIIVHSHPIHQFTSGKEKNGVARACSQTKPLILLREALLITLSHNESMCQTFLILPGEARLSRVMGQFATTVWPARLLSSLFCRRAGEASTVMFVIVGRAARQRGHIGEWLLLLLATIDFSSWCRRGPVLDDGLGALRGGCNPGVVRLRHISRVFRCFCRLCLMEIFFFLFRWRKRFQLSV